MRATALVILSCTLYHLGQSKVSGQGPTSESFVALNAVWNRNDALSTTVPVQRVCFSPDGKHLLLAADRGVSVWDWAKGKESHYFPFPKETKLTYLAVSPGGKQVLTSHQDRSRALLWDLQEGVVLREFNHEAPIHALAFSPDGKLLATGGGHAPEERVPPDHHVQIWTAQDRKPLSRLTGLQRPVRTIAFAGDQVIAEDDRGEVIYWDRESGKTMMQLSSHSFATPLSIPGKGTRLFGYDVGAGRFLARWIDGKKDRRIDMSPMAQPSRHGFWANGDGNLAATSHPEQIVVWDMEGKVQRTAFPIPRGCVVHALVFSPDGSEIIAALSTNKVVRLSM